MISFMVPTKLDWSGLVLSTQNLSSEYVNLPSWYRPQINVYINIYTVVQKFGISKVCNVSSAHHLFKIKNICNNIHYCSKVWGQ